MMQAPPVSSTSTDTSTEPGPMPVATMTENHMSKESPIARLRHTSARRPHGIRSHVAVAPSPRATATRTTVQVEEVSSSAHDSVTMAVTVTSPETIQDGAGAPTDELCGSGRASPCRPTR